MSMKNLTGHVNTRKTPQSEAIPGREKDMTPNSAGGYSFAVDMWTRLSRFLILGSDGGTYYANERKLTQENAKVVLDCLAADGLRTVATIVTISDEGRAVKNTPAIFALAMAAKLGDDETRKAALTAVPKVCRIGTHLFQFAEAIKAFGGFGRGTQRALASWYTMTPAERLAYQVVKYQSREGWSHRDILRKAKPSGHERGSSMDHILGWATGKWAPGDEPSGDATDLIWAFERAKAIGQDSVSKAGTKAIVNLITDYRLPREAIPTQYLNEVAVWDALLDNGGRGMPMTAMVRNLPKMTSIGLISGNSEAAKKVMAKLRDEKAIQGARLHPLSVLVAMRTYGSGHGVRGSLTWTPNRKIVDALDGAFYKAFKAVTPTGKRFLLAFDVSGSMSAPIAGLPGINCREASAAMAMVTDAVEDDTHVIGFTAQGGWGYSQGKLPNFTTVRGYNQRSMWGGSGDSGVSVLDVSARRRLDDNIRTISNLPFGGTDCALPMVYAKQEKLPVDVFVVYTDSETWHSATHHPVQALDAYKQKMGIDAKLIVVGMTATEFSIADPKRNDNLDVVGFDTAAPKLMSEFAMGRL